MESKNYILIKVKKPIENCKRETPKTTWNAEFYVLGAKAYSNINFIMKESKIYLNGIRKITKKRTDIENFIICFFGRREYTAKRDKEKKLLLETKNNVRMYIF